MGLGWQLQTSPSLLCVLGWVHQSHLALAEPQVACHTHFSAGDLSPVPEVQECRV